MTVIELLEMEKEVIRSQYELELAKLKEQSQLIGTGDMDWLKTFLNIKTDKTIKQNILYTFREELEGNIVDYPPQRGGAWYINKSKFAEWYASNFGRINRRIVR